MSRFNEKPSNLYIKARDILQKLLKEEGEEMVNRVFAEVVEKERIDRFTQKYDVNISKDRICVQRLNNNKCNESLPNETCDCLPPGADHFSLYNKDGTPYIIVSQPYEFSYENIRKTINFCNKYNLRVDISGWPSWHFPGNTFLITYKRF